MLPTDPNILYSYLNTKLRNDYSSIAALCDDMYEDESEIMRLMEAAGFHYDAGRNQFVQISGNLLVCHEIGDIYYAMMQSIKKI